MTPSVSVLIPTFNGERYIAEAIESALAQTIPAHEIIVVDDGSTDGTEAVVRRFAGKVRYIRQNNKGVSGAYNTGIDAATGTHIAFLEHDDVWLPEKTVIQLAAFAEGNDIGMVFSPVVLIEDGVPSKRDHIDPQFGGGEYSFADFFKRNRVLNCSSVMIKRVVLEAVGGFREDLRLAFDYDLWLRVAAEYRIISLSEPLAQYRLHGGNLSRDDNELMAAEGSLKTMLHWVNNAYAHKQVGSKAVKERCAALHRRVAWAYAQLGRRNVELVHLWEAVKLQPLGLPGWRRYLWSRVTPQTRSRLTWYGHRVMNLFR
jgi:glycosyltransferase involved in cell wall biosynthesis